jgi:hypothetical protein
MSTIAILRELMERLAMKRNVPVVHPWEEFDMIGGTSTVRIFCSSKINFMFLTFMPLIRVVFWPSCSVVFA